MPDLRQKLLKECPSLHRAVGRRDPELVARVLEEMKEGHRKADQTTTAPAKPVPELEQLFLGATPLQLACATVQPQVASVLLKAGANVNAARPSDGYAALNIAAETQERNIVKVLLEAGADPDIANMEHVTPLHFAAKLGDPGITSDLLAAGADQMRRTLGKQLRPIHFASFGGRPDIVELLVEAAPSSAPAGLGKLARKRLLEVSDARGQKPLHCAVQGGKGGPETVKTLLRLGADVNAVAYTRGLTPLMLAAMKVLPTIAKVLVEVGGADVNVANDHGETILHMSARMCDAATAAVLLRAGADVSAKDLDGRDAAACVKMPPTPMRPPHLALPREADKQAYLRLLERAPAFRASSWRWPAHGGSDSSSCSASPPSSSSSPSFWNPRPPSSSASAAESASAEVRAGRPDVRLCRRRRHHDSKPRNSRDTHDNGNERRTWAPMPSLWRYSRKM